MKLSAVGIQLAKVVKQNSPINLSLFCTHQENQYISRKPEVKHSH